VSAYKKDFNKWKLMGQKSFFSNKILSKVNSQKIFSILIAIFFLIKLNFDRYKFFINFVAKPPKAFLAI